MFKKTAAKTLEIVFLKHMDEFSYSQQTFRTTDTFCVLKVFEGEVQSWGWSPSCGPPKAEPCRCVSVWPAPGESYLLEAFLLCPSHSCLRCRKPSSWDVGASGWVLAGSVAAWLALPLRDAPGDPAGLGSDTPFTCSPPSTLSWNRRETSQRTTEERWWWWWSHQVIFKDLSQTEAVNQTYQSCSMRSGAESQAVETPPVLSEGTDAAEPSSLVIIWDFDSASLS